MSRQLFQTTSVLVTLILSLASTGQIRAQTPPAPKKPNILFALADDWSYGHAGAYGCKWVKTPAFDRVASEGLLFNNAYTPDAKCAPSRSCIITGRNPWQLKAAANHWCYFPPEIKSFPEAMGEHGYFTGMTGKGWAPGVATNTAGVLREMVGKPYENHKLTPPTPDISDNDYAANFADFLNAAPKDKPWFFWYGGREPHRPYEFGSGIAKGGKKLSDIDRVPLCWPDNEQVRNDMLDYAFKAEHFDKHLGLMLAELEKRGLLENTIVVVTGDNGMPFPHFKGYAYFESNHLPLAIMWKNGIRKPGRVVDDFVNFIDFAPTFLQVAGLPWNETGMYPITGKSLAGYFDTEKSGHVFPERDHILVGKERTDVGRPHDWGYPIRGILKDETLYLHNFETNRWPGGNPQTGYADTDGSPTKTEVLKTRLIPGEKIFWDVCFGKLPADQLFNFRQDPDCVTNLAASVDFASLKEQLFLELKQQEDPRIFGLGYQFDEYPSAAPDERGFYEEYLSGKRKKSIWASPTDYEPDFEKKSVE
ncbi:MAG: sulfatase [Verrucomicrobiae bacterium]